jgi:hypothetical protein
MLWRKGYEVDDNLPFASLGCLRFFDAGLSAGYRFCATVARVGKHD